VRVLGESLLDDADEPGLPQYDERATLGSLRSAPETEGAWDARRRLEERIRDKRETDRLKAGFYLEERPQQHDVQPEEADDVDGDEPEAD